LSDALFTSQDYGIPYHLVTSLPANLLLWLPTSLRAPLKWPIYLGAALCWIGGLVLCSKAQRSPLTTRQKISFSLIVGCLLSSFALPHLLYYDLCVLIPAGYLLLNSRQILPATERGRRVAAAVWLCISLYLPIALTFAPPASVALFFEAVLVALLALALAPLISALKQPNAV
jgi:hypothetical protein